MKIRVLGKTYTVRIFGQKEIEFDQNFGSCDPRMKAIRIAACDSENMEETLLHEIIEAINYQLSLELEHPQIQALSETLYSVLTTGSRDISLKINLPRKPERKV